MTFFFGHPDFSALNLQFTRDKARSIKPLRILQHNAKIEKAIAG